MSDEGNNEQGGENENAEANKSIADGGGGGDQVDHAAPADWPTDWRNKMAGEDEKALAKLDRFGSPNDLMKSYRALEQKMSSGEVTNKLGENPTDDELAAWRKDNGVPLESGGYFNDLPDGLVIGDDDKPLFESVAKELHGINASPETMHSLTKWYYDLQENAQADQVEADTQFRQASEDSLRSEWGAEFRQNVNSVNAFLTGAFPEGVSDLLLGARLSDGTMLGDNPDILKSFASMAREMNPAATVVPAAGSNAGVAIADEIATIKGLMGDKNSEYWKGPKSQTMQSRYTQLIEAQMKMAKVT